MAFTSLLGAGCGDDADADSGTSGSTDATQTTDGGSSSSSSSSSSSTSTGTTESGTSLQGSSGTDGTSGGADSSGSASSEGTGDTDDTGGGPTPKGFVNCGEIAEDGPTIGPGEPGPLGFPEVACYPRADNGGGAYTCCSDDPAALDGTPIFSAANNGLGTSGLCVRTGDLPDGSGLPNPEAANCPIPCNPTWSEGDVTAVCGAGRVCCQTREIQPEDCVQDDDGMWRPATGQDIFEGNSNWAPGLHATHQDPGGQGCATFAGTSDVGNPIFAGCLQALTVADQRGFCLALEAGQACPGAGEPNACDLINAGEIPPPG